MSQAHDHAHGDEDHNPFLAHHFDTMGQQAGAAKLGMWLFLAQEILFFGGLFTAYMLYRWREPEAFAAGSHELDITLGLINTVILIGSSLTMALGVHAAQTETRIGQSRFQDGKIPAVLRK